MSVPPPCDDVEEGVAEYWFRMDAVDGYPSGTLLLLRPAHPTNPLCVVTAKRYADWPLFDRLIREGAIRPLCPEGAAQVAALAVVGHPALPPSDSRCVDQGSQEAA